MAKCTARDKQTRIADKVRPEVVHHLHRVIARLLDLETTTLYDIGFTPDVLRELSDELVRQRACAEPIPDIQLAELKLVSELVRLVEERRDPRLDETSIRVALLSRFVEPFLVRTLDEGKHFRYLGIKPSDMEGFWSDCKREGWIRPDMPMERVAECNSVWHVLDEVLEFAPVTA